MPVRSKGNPMSYTIQMLLDGEWETVSACSKRQQAIAEAKRLADEVKTQYRVVLILTTFETGAPA